MARLEFEVTDEKDVSLITRWRLGELKQAGYEETAAFAIAADTTIDLHLATDLLRRGCPPALAVRILL
jgi:hypothetical protein